MYVKPFDMESNRRPYKGSNIEKTHITKRRIQTHPVIDSYDQIEGEQKREIEKIIRFIGDICPGSKVYLFGSRVKGTWIEESDYDLIVDIDPNSKGAEIIRNKKFNVKTDFWFSKEPKGLEYIQIK